MPDIELILARALAAHLSVPVFLADAKGNFVFFNEAAEMLTGKTMEDPIDFGPEDLYEMLEATTVDGEPVNPEDLPVPRAIQDAVPAYLHAISGKDDGRRFVATAVPLLDGGYVIGAMMFLYEDKK